MKTNKEDNPFECFNEMRRFELYKSLLNDLNQHPINNTFDEHIKKYHDFIEKFELSKSDFINSFTYFHTSEMIDDLTLAKALDPLIPKCKYDNKTEVFTMDLSFVPYLKFKYLRDFTKAKNALVFLIMEGIKRMKEKPHYDKEAVLIIFSMQNPYVFDIDNIEVKYVIDAMRYSHFFRDDSCKYVSYMVEGKETKGQCLITVKIIKKSAIKYIE